MAAYGEITAIITSAGFVRNQDSVFCHLTGCLLWQACLVVYQISRLPWAASNFQGVPHIVPLVIIVIEDVKFVRILILVLVLLVLIKDIRVAIQRSPEMVMAAFARGGPFPRLPIW